MVLFDEIGGMDVIDGFPGVVASWVTFPLDQILEGLTVSEQSVVDNCFDFELLISLHEVRGRSREVGTV